jgi:hypothetical protein
MACPFCISGVAFRIAQKLNVIFAVMARGVT